MSLSVGSTPTPPAVPTAAQNAPVGVLFRGRINHVILIVQENRTFDNVFGGSASGSGPVPYPKADSTWPAAVDALMAPVAFDGHPAPNNLHNAWECLYQGGWTLNAWITQAGHDCSTAFLPVNPTPAGSVTVLPAPLQADSVFEYLTPYLRTIYWQIANQYLLGDNFFAITNTGSWPAHQFIVAAQSVDTDFKVVADQPAPGNGCFATANPATPDPSATVRSDVPELPPGGGFATTVTRGYGGVCYPWRTFGDSFAGGIGSSTFWKHYTTPNTANVFGVFDGFINMQNWYQAIKTWPQEPNGLYSDITANALPRFAWVKPPCVDSSDHPGTGNYGPNWVGTVINKIGTSPAWNSSVIFVIWDDWGGFYDHRTPPPQRADGSGPGLRIPFLMISPWGSAQGGVVHTVADFGSIMKFVDDLYNVPPLNAIDANAADLSGFFNLSPLATPAPFSTIQGAVQVPWDPSMCSKDTPLPVD